jgi:hypothetical protein
MRETPMETIAVYFESTLRTYGFNLKEGLLLCQSTIPYESLGFWGKELQTLAASSQYFHLVWACPGKLGEIKFFILCDDAYWENIAGFIQHWKKLKVVQNLQCESSMELIYFQGPHFGDRHGIADFTLKALLRGKLAPQAMTCSGATVCLIFQKTLGIKAKAILSGAFEIPQKK